MTQSDVWTSTEQKLLYRALRRLVGQRVFLAQQPGANTREAGDGRLTFEWVATSAFMTRAATPGWESNLRAGRLGRARAADLFSWLQMHFPDEARVLVNEIARSYSVATQSPWEEFIREHGIFGTVSIHPPRSKRHARIATMEEFEEEETEKVTARVPLHRPFNFGIEASGFVVGLQWVRGHWFALRLAQDRLGFRIGTRWRTNDVVLDGPKLIENDQPGLHRFVLLETVESNGASVESLMVPDMPIPGATLLKLVELLEPFRPKWLKVHRLNAMVVIAEHYGSD